MYEEESWDETDMLEPFIGGHGWVEELSSQLLGLCLPDHLP